MVRMADEALTPRACAGRAYPALEGGVARRYAIGLLLLLLVGKMVATSLTMGIGGAGGVFAPSLFVGAVSGTGYGKCHTLSTLSWPDRQVPTPSSAWARCAPEPPRPRSSR